MNTREMIQAIRANTPKWTVQELMQMDHQTIMRYYKQFSINILDIFAYAEEDRRAAGRGQDGKKYPHRRNAPDCKLR